MKKALPIIILIIAMGASFYGGTLYQKQQASTGGFNRAGGMGGMRSVNALGGFTAGSILSKDANSITIQMQNGSTKIALLATSTQVMKTATGSIGDLSIGTEVTVAGTANADGSVTAQTIQIRPAGMRGGFGASAGR